MKHKRFCRSCRARVRHSANRCHTCGALIPTGRALAALALLGLLLLYALFKWAA